MRLEHSGENDTVKHYIILANEVYELGIFFAPVIRPLVGELFGGTDITYGGIEPNIQYLSFGIG